MIIEQANCAVELTGAGAPEWVQLLPIGRIVARDDRAPWINDKPADVITASKARGIDAVIDYEHQTDNAPKNGQPAPAAGWIKELELRGDGIWGRVEWTAAAKAMIERKEYRFLSPAFTYDKETRQVKSILRAALTNDPALSLTALAREEHPSMDEFLKQLAAALGIAATADQQALLSAVTALAGTAKAKGDQLVAIAKAVGITDSEDPANAIALAMSKPLAGVARTLGLAETATAKEIEAALAKRIENPDPAKFVTFEQFDKVSKALATLQGDLQGKDAIAAVDQAQAAGKVTPAMRDWAIGLFKADKAKFDDFVAKAPVIVAPGPTGGGKVPGAGEALDAEDLAFCRSMGIKPEDFKKTREQETAR